MVVKNIRINNKEYKTDYERKVSTSPGKRTVTQTWTDLETGKIIKAHINVRDRNVNKSYGVWYGLNRGGELVQTRVVAGRLARIPGGVPKGIQAGPPRGTVAFRKRQIAIKKAREEGARPIVPEWQAPVSAPTKEQLEVRRAELWTAPSGPPPSIEAVELSRARVKELQKRKDVLAGASTLFKGKGGPTQKELEEYFIAEGIEEKDAREMAMGFRASASAVEKQYGIMDPTFIETREGVGIKEMEQVERIGVFTGSPAFEERPVTATLAAGITGGVERVETGLRTAFEKPIELFTGTEATAFKTFKAQQIAKGAIAYGKETIKWVTPAGPILFGAQLTGGIIKPSPTGESFLQYKAEQITGIPSGLKKAAIEEPGEFFGGFAGAVTGGFLKTRGIGIKGPVELKIERKLYERQFRKYIEKQIKDVSPDEAALFRKKVKAIKDLDFRTKVVDPNLDLVRSKAGAKLSPAAKKIVKQWLVSESKRGQVLTGSLSTKTQLKGKVLQVASRDIDVFSAVPDESIGRLSNRLKAAGLKVKYKGNKLVVEGVKIESHALAMAEGSFTREAFGYLEKPRKTPSGILVTDIREQAFRKLIAAEVGGPRRLKDIPALEKRIAPELAKAARARAETRILPRTGALERFEAIFKTRRGFYQPSVSYKPTTIKPSVGLATISALTYKPSVSYKPTIKFGAYPKAAPYKPADIYKPTVKPSKYPRGIDYRPSKAIAPSYKPAKAETYKPSPTAYKPSPALKAPYAGAPISKAPIYSPKVTGPSTILPRPIIAAERKEKKKRKRPAYHTFVRESRPKGKAKITWVRVSKEPLPRKRAWNLGALYADRTTAATFQIRRKGDTILRDVNLLTRRAKFRYKKPKSKISGFPTYIEKNKYRIDTPTELAGITVKGLQAIRAKRGLI